MEPEVQTIIITLAAVIALLYYEMKKGRKNGKV